MFLSHMKTTAKTTEVHNRIRTRKTISAISSFIVRAHYLHSVLHPYSLLFLFFFHYVILKPQELLLTYLYIPSSFFAHEPVFFLTFQDCISLFTVIHSRLNQFLHFYCSMLCSFPFYVHATFSLLVVC